MAFNLGHALLAVAFVERWIKQEQMYGLSAVTKKKWPLVEFRLYTKYKTGIEICKADLTKVNFL